MNFFLIFALIFFTIIVAIFLQKLVNSPILIGLLFFSVFLILFELVSVLAGWRKMNDFILIVSVVLGIIAFISAFLFCIVSRCNFFDNCNNSNDVSTANLNTTNNNCSCSSSQPLTILNSDGEIVARINGDNVTCTSQQNDNNSCLRSYRHS